jgi:hypothetical protein
MCRHVRYRRTLGATTRRAGRRQLARGAAAFLLASVVREYIVRAMLAAMSDQHGSVAAVSRLLREIEALLKHPSITIELGHRGVNASVTLLAIQGLTAYVEGNRHQASEDFATVAEEIRTRLAR